jgi:hypothetical protein
MHSPCYDLKRRYRHSGPALFSERVAAGSGDPTKPNRFSASIRECDELYGAKPEVTTFPAHHGPEHPSLRPGVVDKQVQAVAIGMSPSFLGADGDCGQALVWMAAVGLHVDTPRIKRRKSAIELVPSLMSTHIICGILSNFNGFYRTTASGRK